MSLFAITKALHDLTNYVTYSSMAKMSYQNHMLGRSPKVKEKGKKWKARCPLYGGMRLGGKGKLRSICRDYLKHDLSLKQEHLIKYPRYNHINCLNIDL